MPSGNLSAVRTPLAALLASRALVWAVGVTAFATYGTRDSRVPHLGTVADALAAPIVGWLTGSLLLGGAVVSLAAFLAGLYFVQRLAELEIGPDAARRTVWL